MPLAEYYNPVAGTNFVATVYKDLVRRMPGAHALRMHRWLLWILKEPV